ncbi:hypothetical protein SAMN04488540_101331 [Ferrimonas sediminum]|uniref:Uncharacterized protein n=1 Tax=Ferrimonas sediminum TaxID=718193 RepID=A0A1G8KCW8_9GAMM|nr:hypothetical protein [Ferrimonas sediminum]SDI41306.1 hypothetical protein SAMN04488540_101331 [Ferrimonas sediminum]
MTHCKILTLSGLLSLLAACGGSSGSSAQPEPLTGYLKDSALAGVNYHTPSLSGLTGPNGEYQYREGEQVTFHIGTLPLGDAPGAPLTTPVELLAQHGFGDTEVTNMVRLLMALDTDQDPVNGIQIGNELRNQLKQQIDASGLTLDEANMTSLLSQLNIFDDQGNTTDVSLPTALQAQAHLENTLRCGYAGLYVGQYSGDDTGFFAAAVDPVSLTVRGSLHSSQPYQPLFGIEASAPIFLEEPAAPLSMGITGAGSDAGFLGTISNYSEISGSWIWPDVRSGGDFQAEKVIPDDEGAQFKYVGTYRVNPLGGTPADGVIQILIHENGVVDVDYINIFDEEHTHVQTQMTQGQVEFTLYDAFFERQPSFTLPLSVQAGEVVDQVLSDDYNGNDYHFELSSCRL